MKNLTSELLKKIKENSPLVHNITNFVVMNYTANILLAMGASPVMSHSIKEVEEMSSMAGAVVLNIGTLQDDWVDSMICAAKAANKMKIPVILDPVGSGATRLRTESVKRIMAETKISVLRGNVSEIFSLSSSAAKTRGVDSSLEMSEEIIASAMELSEEKNCIIAISGATDYITDGKKVFCIDNGHPIMTKVTGTGCGLSSTIAAFCAVAEGKILEATASAFGFYGVCAEMAAEISEKPGGFSVAFVDSLYSAGKDDLDARLRIRNSF